MGNCPHRKAAALLTNAEDDGQLAVQLITLGSGIAVEVSLPNTATVKAIKESAKAELGIPAENQQLVFGTRVLHRDSCTLSELGLQPGTKVEITVVRRLQQQVCCNGPDNSLLLWDLESRAFLRRLDNHHRQGNSDQTETMQCLAVDWISMRAISGVGSSLSLWDLNKCIILDQLLELDGSAKCVAVNWCSGQAMSGSGKGSLYKHSLNDVALVESRQSGEAPVVCLEVDWQSNKAITGGGDCIIRLWDMICLEQVRQFSGHLGPVLGLSVHWASTNCITGAGDGTLRLWQLQNGQSELFHPKGHRGPVTCIDVDWVFGRMVSGGFDGTLRLWRIDTRDVVFVLHGHTTKIMSVSLDWSTGRLLSGAEGSSKPSTLKLWTSLDLEDPKDVTVVDLKMVGEQAMDTCRLLAVNWILRDRS
eukprot:TRINITY_DN27602_c0_g1_i1.p1 TRINITY_DN27602_c0_g1~~TRINITY_DN27602_c0_g1_i1.p1  ORF type:complete len:419 (+),score=56.31 TRINITY_DN27602_c0_g1_i1:179-1435(+)